ncbi:hypothetical protein C4D60_Mb10t00910 [Musa balbisiana]|uniref:Uncharacterized protein n=1 Tax=Musa balbisiana TaxID=52838 RepID=A0A4S8ITV8_MUSBA|nr:hypothetical protein C4D60_Mb10t00910 [Musa balbisiana]
MFLVQKRLFCLFPRNNSSIYLSSYQLCSLFNFSTAKYDSSEHSSNFIVVNPLQSCELSSEKAAKTAKYHTCRKNSSSLSIEFFKQHACRRNLFLLTSSLARKIEPNISLLRECGISDECIAHMVVLNSGFLVRKNKFIKEVMEHVEELGVPHDCGMFPHALVAVLNISRSKCDAIFATLKSFGWSQPDIIAILRKNPCVWRLSKNNISDKMTFLMKEAGCELQYIICHPGILAYSLEKRLRPRHEVIKFLEQNKFLDKGHSLLYVMPLTEQKFMNKFLFPYKEKFTALYKSYVAAVRGKHHVVTED